MQNRTPRALAAAAALALFAGACADVPTTAPSARAPGAAASRSTSSGPVLISNSVRYRDQGARPARGRAGNAAVEALALVDRQGNAVVEYSARHATDPSLLGSTPRVQLKAVSRDGVHKFTRNLVESDAWHGPANGSPGVIQLPGIVYGDQLQMQAHVTGIDPHRVDVVTVTQDVKRVADLAVDLSAPAEPDHFTNVNFLAVVSELNGDVGANARCELYVDGALADIIQGVWVDAGDAVTCAFTHMFTVPGAHTVEVRVRNAGREWDEANNTDTATVVVNGTQAQFRTSAWFEDSRGHSTMRSLQRWEDTEFGSGSEEWRDDWSAGSSQQASMQGSMPVRTDGPVHLQVSMSTGGYVVDAGAWTANQVPNFFGWCALRVEGRATFNLCSADFGMFAFTSFTYAFVAGTVTYHSEGYSKVWDALSGPEGYVYHWNEETTSGTAPVPLGDDWTFDVRIGTTAGNHVITRPLQLNRVVYESESPYECFSFGSPEEGFVSTYCSGSTNYQEFTSGSAYD
jgi:hypothetical protein